MDDKKITRTDLLNFLAEKYNLQSYLEIGLQDRTQNFDKIKCGYKISVDPDPKADAIFCLTSDEYFSQQHENNPAFDLIFLDGLHTAEQVKKDFENALKVLSPNGWIVIHDCNPEKEEHTIVPRPTERGHWNGSCYKFAALLRFSGSYTVDIDNGLLVFSNRRHAIDTDDYAQEIDDITWDFFDKNRKELLNLISWDEFVKS